MRSALRAQFWFEAGLSGLCGALALLTVVRRDWIEVLTGFDADRHLGALEWALPLGLLIAALLASMAARAEGRRGRTPERALL